MAIKLPRFTWFGLAPDAKPAATPVVAAAPIVRDTSPFKLASAVIKDAELDPFAREQADAFFRSVSGVDFLNAIAAMRPDILESPKVAAGYERCLTNILTLLRPLPKEEVAESSNYPDLDDPTKWSEAETK